MKPAHLITLVSVFAVFAAVCNPIGRAEPKNQTPFTLTTSTTNAPPDWFERYAAAHPYGTLLGVPAAEPRGESKNERPFTRPASTYGTQPSQPSTPSVSHSVATATGSFHWRDALLGAAAATAAFIAAVGLLATTRVRRTAHV
jgi:hypothetical protein